MSKKEEKKYLGFGCTWPGFKIKVTSSKRDKETKQIILGDSIKFEGGRVKLDVKKDLPKIKVLVEKEYFENDKPGMTRVWPLNVDEYNEFAKENDLPVIDRKGGEIFSASGASKESIQQHVKDQLEIKKLRDEIEALQNSVSSSNRKGK